MPVVTDDVVLKEVAELKVVVNGLTDDVDASTVVYDVVSGSLENANYKCVKLK